MFSGMRVFIPPSPFPTSLVICQAAINQAFILGIKVTFRSRFHALMLWKAGVEEDDGQRGIDLDEVLAGVVVEAYGHNAVVVAGDIMTVTSKLWKEMIRFTRIKCFC